MHLEKIEGLLRGMPVSHSGAFLFRKLACMLAHTHPLHHTVHPVLLVSCAGPADFGALSGPCGVSFGVSFVVKILCSMAGWFVGRTAPVQSTLPPAPQTGGGQATGPRCNDMVELEESKFDPGPQI